MLKRHQIFYRLQFHEQLKLLKHIRLGKPHLLEYLGETEFNKLLETVQISQIHKKHLKTTPQERIGNFVVVFNTLITSCLGMSMGGSSFANLIINIHELIVILVISLGLSCFVGYLSLQSTRRQARESLINLKLYLLQLTLMKIIIKRREKSIRKTCRNIALLLNENFDMELPLSYDASKLPSLIDSFNDKQLIDCIDSREISYLKHTSLKQYIHAECEKIILHIQTQFNKVCDFISHDNIDNTSTASTAFNENDLLVSTSMTNASYIHLLIKPDTPTRKMIPVRQSWLRSNFIGVCVGLLPTIFGGFASMFVFLTGVPSILAKVHLLFELPANIVNLIKTMGLMSAFSLTFYFGYSHLHTNYRAFVRSHQLQKAENKVALFNDKMIRQLNILYPLKRVRGALRNLQHLMKLTHLFKLSESQSSHKKSTAPDAMTDR